MFKKLLRKFLKTKNFRLKKKMHSKRGQVTIFIIIAVAIVALVVMAIILIPKLNKTKAPVSEKIDPEIYISDCINEDLGQMVKTIAEQGGELELKNCIFYKTVNDPCRAYLCYQTVPYVACVNQEPLLKEKIEQELKNELSKDNIPYSCIRDFASNAEKKGYDVSTCSLSEMEFNVVLIKGKVTVPINCSISLDKNDDHERFTTITPALDWPLYEFVMTTKEIINTEISDTDFDPMLYTRLHTWIDIEKFTTSTNEGVSEIYTLREVSTGKEFVFAIKNNFWKPAGIL